LDIPLLFLAGNSGWLGLVHHLPDTGFESLPGFTGSSNLSFSNDTSYNRKNNQAAAGCPHKHGYSNRYGCCVAYENSGANHFHSVHDPHINANIAANLHHAGRWV
jgi:hypothetical protein